MKKIKGKRISRNIILKGEMRSKKEKSKRPSTVDSEENSKNESKNFILAPSTKLASRVADFWVEARSSSKFTPSSDSTFAR